MENPTNTWGDGLPFTQWGNLGGPNGQTAAVDAHSAMATTWDFYTKVLGWKGLDGQGTTPYAQVLDTSRYGVDNAYWSPWSFSLTLGAGSSTLPTSHPNYNPEGFKSMADFDVIAHEMGHGVTSPNRWVNGGGVEEAGMAEGTSDFLSQMAKLWAQRPAGAPEDAIPATGGDWQIGKNITPNGLPLRWMDKPSRDERSADAWYQGVNYMDGHYSAGILNRALYFLANGASAIPGSDAYSPYLPGGMSGLGNDAAARIWFTTITERLAGGGVGKLKFLDCREEAIAVAKELYGGGADCVQSMAVENAFAAVNVGLGHGQASRTQVLFTDFRNGDWHDLAHSDPPGTPGSRYNNRQLFPEGHTVRPRVSVLNNTNTEVTWTLGGPSQMLTGSTPGQYGWSDKGGKLNPDGSWTTPWDGTTSRPPARPIPPSSPKAAASSSAWTRTRTANSTPATWAASASPGGWAAPSPLPIPSSTPPGRMTPTSSASWRPCRTRGRSSEEPHAHPSPALSPPLRPRPHPGRGLRRRQHGPRGHVALRRPGTGLHRSHGHRLAPGEGCLLHPQPPGPEPGGALRDPHPRRGLQPVGPRHGEIRSLLQRPAHQ
jgi:hypothetical protein